VHQTSRILVFLRLPTFRLHSEFASKEKNKDIRPISFGMTTRGVTRIIFPTGSLWHRKKEHGCLGIPNSSDMNLSLPFGHPSEMMNIKLTPPTFSVVTIELATLFGRVLCGLLRQPRWDIDEKLVMVEKLDFGRISGLGVLAILHQSVTLKSLS
jgi:hypothetical protein